ncbi:bifunctional DNA-formamidopyrimidine glycosylase/DNA-(apurinic or apyrimidinic site) lyase [bacterium]|nr:bifunctional DNA-formamidopyrimidine glycosylase/DNA-(apurinic or apyrimidinic site) lyase [bacterium]
MPELPEVETIRRDLEKEIVNKKIIALDIRDSKVVLGKKSNWEKELLGNKISKLLRVGKLLSFKLSTSKYVLIHLKMTGQLIYQKKDKLLAGGHPFSKKSKEKAVGGELPNKFTRLIIELSDNSFLYFNNIRRFAYAKIVSERDWLKEKEKFGLEPKTDNFVFKDFFKVINSRKSNIKSVLLNQSLIAGLGNIYVDESLFLSKIDPRRLSNEVSEKEAKLLFKSIDKVIEKALRYRGTTFSDYVDSKGNRGDFFNKLKVYGRKGKKCLACGEKIAKIKVAGRGTHFCPKCQK